MNSAKSASTIPFRSKKPALHTTPKKPGKLSPVVDGVALETPEKSNRVRNRNVALSCKDVRNKIRSLQQQKLNSSDLDSSAGTSGQGSGGKGEGLQGMATRSEGNGGRVKNLMRFSELPEKFEMLCTFFNSIVNIIRLNRMRRMTTTFTSIISKIEPLTRRKFTISHMAQLKQVMPELIVVEKIRIRDELTECAQEDLHISLNYGALGPDGFAKDLGRIFRSRVEDYLKSHSEEEDIPEAELPVLFYQPKKDNIPSVADKRSSVPVSASHLAASSQSSFYRKASSLRRVEDASRFHLIPSPLAETRPAVSAEHKENDSSAAGSKDESLTSPAQLPITGAVLMSPAGKKISTDIKDEQKTSDSTHDTPIKDASTPARLMASTPLPQASKRPMTSPLEDKSPAKLVRRSQRSRSLKFHQVEQEAAPSENQQDEQQNDLADVLSENLLQSLREKERKLVEEKTPAISQAKRRHQLIAGLPKFFDLIRLIFQSINRSVITKQELLYRTVTGHSNIVDKGEAEEQLKLLTELAPDFLSERSSSDGDTLIRLNKSVNAQAVRMQLLKAE